MKKTTLLQRLAILVLSLGAVACSTTDSLYNGRGSVINAGFNSTDSKVDYEYSESTTSGTTTKKIAANWNANDRLVVYAGSVSASTKSNPVYTLSDGGGTKSATFKGGQLQGTLTEGTTPLYAYVEKTGQTINESNSTVTVDFTGQTGTLADATSRDVLFGTTTYSTAGVNVGFNHLMAIVRLNLTLPKAGNCSITLQNEDPNYSTGNYDGRLYSSVTLDATTGALKSGTKAMTLSLNGNVAVTAGSNVFYVCLYPQAVKELSALITYTDGTKYYAKIQNDSKTFEAGKLYTSDHVFYAATKYISSTKNKPVTLIVTGVDFSDAELAAGGAFETKAKACIDFMFDVEPYKTYKEYFNVYIIPLHSKDIGYIGPSGEDNNGNFSKTHSVDGNKLYSFMQYNCPDLANYDGYELTIAAIANTTGYYGMTNNWNIGMGFAVSSLREGTMYWAKNNSGVVSNSGDYRNIFLHEFGGHAFGRLNDEYWYDNNETYSSTSDGGIESGHSWSVVFGKNIVSKAEKEGTTGYYWEHMMTGTIKTYSKEGRNYEGGGGSYGKGVYRPEQVSVMDDNRCYFNAYSRQLIVERILRLAGETFSYATFVSKDVDTDPTSTGSSTRTDNVTIMPPLSHPELIKVDGLTFKR